IGNEALVFNALRELEKGGFIALSTDAPSVWEQGKQKVKAIGAATAHISPFSAFEPSQAMSLDESAISASGQISSFGTSTPGASSKAVKLKSPPPPVELPPRKAFGERWGWVGKMRISRSGDIAPYRRVSWRRRVGFGVALIIVFGFLALLLFPYGTFRPAIEATLTQAVGVPVKVGDVDVQLYPRPAFVLRDVRLSENGAARIGTIFVPQFLSPAAGEKKTVREAILTDVVLSADFAASLPRMLDGIRNSPSLAVEHVSLRNVSVTAGNIGLRDLSGEIVFKPGGGISVLSLSAPDRSLQVQLAPAAVGANVSIEGFGWKPAESSPYVFGAIAAKGSLQSGKLVMQQVEFGLADGLFQGSWWFDWSQGFTMAGDGVIAHAKLKQLVTIFSVPLGLEGEISGNLRVRASGAHWQGMWDASEITMAAQMERVVINGVDFGTATRRGMGQSVRGGTSKFDRARGNLRLIGQQMTGTGMELDAGLVRAQGEFVARPNKTVDGLFHVRLESSVQPVRAALRISGTLPTLETAVVQ
ncbi:MAG: hypothetical protein ACM3SV_02210, partial [Betaproteobacteria bacterium]